MIIEARAIRTGDFVLVYWSQPGLDPANHGASSLLRVPGGAQADGEFWTQVLDICHAPIGATRGWLIIETVSGEIKSPANAEWNVTNGR